MSEVVKAVQQPLFVKKKHELANVLKALERGSMDAVELIVNTMNATEEEGVSLKTKLECAKIVIDMQIKIAAEISKDELTRQIAEIKVNGMKIPLELEHGEKKRLPATTDFSTIQEVK